VGGSMRSITRLTLAAVVFCLFLLHACHDSPEISEPSLATAVTQYKLTITGSGTGTGVVTSSPAGINCTLTAGRPATTGCSKLYNAGVVVTLTAKPASGHAFGGWVKLCTGLGTCKVTMRVAREVTALFRKGPFSVKITSGSSGVGTGKVTSQTGLSPAINCQITNGVPAAAGCSATYPANVKLTLTATPAANFYFAGWRDPSCGTGSCLFSIIDNLTIPATFSPVASSSPGVQGKWATPFNTPAVGVHTHVLTTGKVLLWGDVGDAQIWDPSTTGFVTVPKTYRTYCTGHAFLPDGRLLITGGTSADTRGLRLASVFDPATKSWTFTAPMAQGRYYPTNTTLPNGQILSISGHDTTLAVVTIPEVWNGSTWRRLTTAPLAIPNPYYPPMFVAPNGKVFLAGFQQTTRYLDVTGTGQWTTVANRNVADRTMGAAVMYAPGKILYAGGGDPPTASAEVIDLTQPSPVWRTVAPMAFARRQLNATILADGTVLVTGGTGGAGFNNQAGAVHTAEIWNPKTETWKTMASEFKNRTYHSTAVLIPSGRVFSTGSGEGGGVPYSNSELSAQLFTPPYLFNADGSAAPRPTISSVPTKLTYGQAFFVQTPDPNSIARGTLIRLSSTTHTFNTSQLLYDLTFNTVQATTLRGVAPATPNLAPPGPYMLFLINSRGVPSIAKIVRLGP
jgi:galactose oxidase-like protein/List-Bact-rpt repeat protein/Kelch motif protein